MAKPELGNKRTCTGCGSKFYDLNRDPIVCPKCGTAFEEAPRAQPARAAAAAEQPAPAAEEAAAPEKQKPEPETISLDEADKEQTGAKRSGAADDEDEEFALEDEDDETLGGDDDDEAFLEDDEEEDSDVSNLIGGSLDSDDDET